MNYYMEGVTQELVDECKPLLEFNNRETGFLPREANPYWEAFIGNDNYTLATMKDDDANIVGYALFCIGPWSHYKDLIALQQLTFFVLPEFRKYALKFLRFTEEVYQERVDVILQSAVLGSRFGDVLESRGYTPLNIDYIKELH